LSIDHAFTTLRRYARLNNVKLADVARAVAAGELSIPLGGGSSRSGSREPVRDN
jgi:hypothetical protein